jgi:hypothetical protein
MRMHLGYCLVSQRKPDALVILEDGIERRQRAARIFEHRLNDSDGYGFALLGLARADLGDFAGADELISRGLEIVRAVGRRPAESSILITRSVAELFRSNWDGVLAAAAQARDIAVHLRAPYHLAFSDVLSGYAQYRLGELTGGIDSMWRGLEDLERSGAFLSKALSQACIADALSRSGRLAEAEVLARSALERSEVGDLLGDEYAHRALLRVDTQRSRIAAERRVRMLRANAEIRQSRRQSAISELAEAEAAWLLGRPEEAAALASIALDHLEVLAMPGEMEEARALLAAHGRTGERRK